MPKKRYNAEEIIHKLRGADDLPDFFGPKIPRKRLGPGSLLRFS